MVLVYTISTALFESQDMFSLDPRLFLAQTEGSGSRLIHVSHAEIFSYARERNKPGYVLTMTLKMKLHTKLHTATEDCIRYTKWGPINSAHQQCHALTSCLCMAHVPHIFNGASNSSKMGCVRKMSLDFKHSPRTSFSVSWTVFMVREPRTVSERSGCVQVGKKMGVSFSSSN